jgi:hypothetical protein
VEFAADPAFRDEIRALWLQAAPRAATGDAVSNVFYSKADKVIQLRDVHGDLNISLPAHADRPQRAAASAMTTARRSTFLESWL